MKIDIVKFHSLMKDTLQNHKLKDCTVVVDGQNFFYGTYKNSRLSCVFGCECDRYAEFLKEYLSMFKKANVKCFFVFKGGHKDMDSRIKKSEKQYRATTAHFVPGQKTPNVLPVLMKETYKQVLDEMGFDYVVCEYEAKRQCIALAQKLKCPIISLDKEFCFSSVPYIPYTNLLLKNNKILCKIFKLEYFFQKYGITNETFVIFIVLTNNCLSPSSLQKIRKVCKESLFKWLSNSKRDDAVKTIFSCLDSNERAKFLSSENEVRAFLRRQEPGGVPVDYFENGKDIIDHCDPLWFEKGVACRYIAIPYINLYRSNILWGSWAIADQEADDAMALSLDIVKYAYNLLTNFQKQTFSLLSENGVMKSVSAAQPRLQALCGDQSSSVFENGWDQLDGAALFHNFLVEIFGEVPKDAINQAPEDAKLLMISLAYFSRMKRLKNVNTDSEVESIILSYIMLGVVSEIGNSTVTIKTGKKSNLDILINKPNFKSECHAAATSMNDYFKLCDEEMINIFDKKLLHLLVEFQHCLEHMNYLNKLCSSPYNPTIYRKTYNSTFVYKILHALKKESAAIGMSFLGVKSQSSPLILEYFNSLVALYKTLI